MPPRQDSLPSVCLLSFTKRASAARKPLHWRTRWRAPRDGGFGHHYEILEYLVEGLNLPESVREQNRIVRTTRNANMYTGAEDVSEQDLKSVYQWAKRVQTETVGWFQKNMPQALPKR